MRGILTNLSSIFIILVNEMIFLQDEIGGGRTAHGECDNVCVVREMTYVINTMCHCISPVNHPIKVLLSRTCALG